MIHVSSFSTGLSSAVMTERLLQKYSPALRYEFLHITVCNTRIEDDDNWRFSQECFARWKKLYPGSFKVMHLVEGRTPYEVAEDENMIFNQRRAACTRILKIKPFIDYLGTLNTGQVTVHIGYDFQEVHRCEATTRNYNRAGYEVDYPLLWRPVEHRPYTEIVRGWGIEPPQTYAMGFSHANCLMRGCVKMGAGDWIRLLVHFPERFAITEAWEEKMRKRPGLGEYAILRDRTGGELTPKTLRQLREEHERGQQNQPRLLDYNSSCINCGVGDYECDI